MVLYRPNTKIEKCIRCGYNEFKDMLHVHHINEDRTNNEDSNKIVLCNNCHNSLHFGLWQLSEINSTYTIIYSRNDGIIKKKERIAKGLEVWKGRGTDKQKRKTEGYKIEQERRRRLKEGA